MGKTLYLDAASGISGDMTVAALLDLGASEERLREALASLPVHGFEVRVSRVMKSGLAACDFDVVLDAAHENHDHDMAWLFGMTDEDHVHGHDHMHDHVHDHAHEHGPYGEGHDRHDHTCEHRHAEAPHVHGHAGNEVDAHGDEPHAHHHEHRSLADVYAIIDGATLTPRARDLAHRIFAKLGEAEAAAHGTTPERVLLHEVGAIDSIVDICAVAVCLADLDVTDIVVPSLAEGHGTIRCAHGIMPIPVPAVLNLVTSAGIELVSAPVRGELVTPTGAAIVAALRTSSTLPARWRVRAVGLGAGKRTYDNCSGILRAMLIEASDGTDAPGADTTPAIGDNEDQAAGQASRGSDQTAPQAPLGAKPATAPSATLARRAASEALTARDAVDLQTLRVLARQASSRGDAAGHDLSRTAMGAAFDADGVMKLECDLDDCTGEALGRTIDLLMANGAREAHAIPVVMKKNRPGYQLEVVCDEADVERLELLVFRTTTTIGIRASRMLRRRLPRATDTVATRFGEVDVKWVLLPDGQVRGYPEYDSVVAVSERTGASFQDVFRAAQSACEPKA